MRTFVTFILCISVVGLIIDFYYCCGEHPRLQSPMPAWTDAVSLLIKVLVVVWTMYLLFVW
jgi:hypothetical protein